MTSEPELVDKLIRLALDLVKESEAGKSPQEMRQMIWSVLRENGLTRTYKLSGESHD